MLGALKGVYKGINMKKLVVLVVLIFSTSSFAKIRTADRSQYQEDAEINDIRQFVSGRINEKSYLQTLTNCVVTPNDRRYLRFKKESLERFDWYKFVEQLDQPDTKIGLGRAMYAMAYVEYLETDIVPKLKDKCDFLAEMGLMPSKASLRKRVSKLQPLLFLNILKNSGLNGYGH